MRFFLMAATASLFTLSTVMMMAQEAQAVQDTPVTINGVEAVCTGVGSAKDDPRWSAYPVKVVLATVGGANLANAHITLTNGRQEVAGLDCDAPWILFKAPPGAYTVTATLIGGSGRSSSAKFGTTGSGRQKEVTIMFPLPSNGASVPAGAAPAPAGQ
ncbi:MAG: hypothetical protein H0U98_08270 [Alphaproteobacteria bacterium]|nr:hypothetical protein [Alphaproteobacteria bacterium]